MKKVISIILALVLAAVVCIPAFAADTETSSDYDYRMDERLVATSDFKSGEFVWGGRAPAMYQIVNKKMFTLNDLPSEEDEELGITRTLTDSTAALPEFEGVAVNAYYAFNCPECGKANGGITLSEVYGNKQEGKCFHCGELLPDPGTLKIYRFIIIDFESGHYDVLQSYNLAKYSDSVYKDTEDMYGDGKDLPQNLITWKTEVVGEGEEATEHMVYDQTGKPIIDSFKTSGSGKTETTANLYIFLVNFQYRTTPWAEKFVASKYTEFVYNLRLRIVGLWENILTGLVTH